MNEEKVLDSLDTLIEVGGNYDIEGVPPMYLIHEGNTGVLNVFNDQIGGKYKITVERIEE